jgi:hypothetical protein
VTPNRPGASPTAVPSLINFCLRACNSRQLAGTLIRKLLCRGGSDTPHRYHRCGHTTGRPCRRTPDHRCGPSPPASLQPRAPAEPADRHGQASKADRAVAGTDRHTAGFSGTGPQPVPEPALFSSGSEGRWNPKDTTTHAQQSQQNGPEPRQGRAPHQHCPIHLGARKG